MTQPPTAPSARGASPPQPQAPWRVEFARSVIWLQAFFLPLLTWLSIATAGTAVWTLSVAVVGAAVLVAGGIRMGRDERPGTGVLVTGAPRRVPWDWTDFVMFWPAAFTASSVIGYFAVGAVQATTVDVDPTVRTAVESFVAQASFYAGALFNIWVLAGLRRGASLQVIGWRRFSWWWLPVAVVAAWATLYIADFLQTLSQHLFPSAQNTQCVAVQHEYGHFIALAVIVVCVIAPLSEETIFRGFIYGWLHRRLPVALAVPVSGAIFAALHGVLLLFIPLFAVGCILAVMFQASRSLWPGAIVHALFNLPGIISILSSPVC